MRQTLRLCVLFALVSAALALQAWHSAQLSLKHQLLSQIPEAVNASLVNAYDTQLQLAHNSQQLVSHINASAFNVRLPLDFIQQITLRDLTLFVQQPQQAADVSWHYGEQLLGASYTIAVQFAWFNLLGVSALLSMLLLTLYRYLPTIRTQRTHQWQSDLVQTGLNKKQAHKLARQLSADPNESELFAFLRERTQLAPGVIHDLSQQQAVKALTTEQRAWLAAALNHALAEKDAVAVARHPPQLAFDLANQCAIVHGLRITLAKTPLFYYYWYAQRRLAGEPAYTNPTQAKPDRDQGEQLANIMASWGGHQKAIKDLREEGLKSKTLDQNRNKIKTELRRTLGELATHYLFSGERDGKTARYRYCLALAPSAISLTPKQP
ncbi:hypothetical protein [uncultured Gilvimarinus sp.]|uniref:hypothetical protein n=1 Tax=uncultured Gilvimarinus sp. TaxID=1689143 RepID=UPI0030EF4796|tara:strand:- start:491 stop:1630 length:1140 start_codon:yes stop_codon:yes gene_type:complete